MASYFSSSQNMQEQRNLNIPNANQESKSQESKPPPRIPRPIIRIVTPANRPRMVSTKTKRKSSPQPKAKSNPVPTHIVQGNRGPLKPTQVNQRKINEYGNRNPNTPVVISQQMPIRTIGYAPKNFANSMKASPLGFNSSNIGNNGMWSGIGNNKIIGYNNNAFQNPTPLNLTRPKISTIMVPPSTNVLKFPSAGPLNTKMNVNVARRSVPPTMASSVKQYANKQYNFGNENKTPICTNTMQKSTLVRPPPSTWTLNGDDINDVTAMSDINVDEEYQNALGDTKNNEARSCQDETFLHLLALKKRLRIKMMEYGLEEPAEEVAKLISHACEQRLKDIVEKLVAIAENRSVVIKLDPRYEVERDVRGQIKFLQEHDRAEQKRHQKVERDLLMRAAKSRSKIEDPERAKIKAKVKEMQRAELQELRFRNTNMTALQAIGSRKKVKMEDGTETPYRHPWDFQGRFNANLNVRPRIKRINIRDMLCLMEQEKDMKRSTKLYKTYLK